MSGLSALYAVGFYLLIRPFTRLYSKNSSAFSHALRGLYKEASDYTASSWHLLVYMTTLYKHCTVKRSQTGSQQCATAPVQHGAQWLNAQAQIEKKETYFFSQNIEVCFFCKLGFGLWLHYAYAILSGVQKAAASTELHCQCNAMSVYIVSLEPTAMHCTTSIERKLFQTWLECKNILRQSVAISQLKNMKLS